jgi:hypothetical protein
MARSTEQLILDLARDVPPVRRLRPPLHRALGWLAIVAALGGAAIALFANMRIFDARIAHPALVIEMTGALITGCLAVVAAFHLSLPDRSRLWALLPAPSLAVWLAGGGLGCYRQWQADPQTSWMVGESTGCLIFIVAVGLPLAAALLWSLRRARPLAPVPVAVLGGLGTAALSAFLLQFFHPFEINFMDMVVHAVAVAIVVVIVTMRPLRRGLLADGAAGGTRGEPDE